MLDSSIVEIPETPQHTHINEIPETPQHVPIQYSWASRDRRQKILLMTDLGYTQRAIADYLRTTRNQVRYTQNIKQATPKKPKGRPPKLIEDQFNKLVEFISTLKQNQ